ncbi:MAG TPA: rod shape-determining protein MreC [Bacillota bacterium]|nr:rod shape-determining protein MreC [Bacillota bacterium]
MQFFTKKRLFILLIGIIFVVTLIGFSLSDRDNQTTAEQFVSDMVGWAQTAVHIPVNGVTSFFSNLDDLKNTYSENRLLKEKLAQYKNLIYEVQELRKENEELRKTLDKTNSLRDFNPIQATVVARSPERWVEQVTINKGTMDGVEDNMAVITADGMIGKIQSASSFTSTVQLLTGIDQFNRISATIAREEGNDVFGLIESYDRKTHSLLFKIIDESDKEIEEGEMVVSSGLGGIFPAGLPIGKVKEIAPDQYGLTNIALVEPAANMYDIDNVIVVERVMNGDAEMENNSEEEERE